MTPLRAPVSLGSLSPDEDWRYDVDTPCPFCGYNLRGLPRGQRCPECGEVDAPPERATVPVTAPEPGRPITFEEDHACSACGYNLRGLPRGQRCPECGHGPGDGPRERERRYGNVRSRPLHDVVLAGETGERRAWRAGLGLATVCVAVAMLARVGFLIATIGPAAPGLEAGYVLLCGANSVVWVVAVWLVTPASLSRQWRWMSGPRWAARALSLMWIVGYGCVLARVVGGVPSSTEIVVGALGGRLLGAVGVMFVAFILGFVAGEAELTDAARRLNAVVWLLWVPTLLAQVFPAGLPWFTVLLLAAVLFFWCWLMTLLALGLRGLFLHARWAHRLVQDPGDRDTRIEAMKRAVDDRVSATVRPLPGPERRRRE